MFLRVFVAITINPVVRIQRAHLIIQKYVQIKVFITDMFEIQSLFAKNVFIIDMKKDLRFSQVFSSKA